MEEQKLYFLDWTVIVTFALCVAAISLYFTKRGSKNIESFFLSGRALPWYVAGISMIATSFASDTPLWVTNLIRLYGVHYVWQYWAPAVGVALGTVLFARLVRRSAVTTDIELINIRYSGQAAKALRIVSGLLGAAFFCPLICAWVTKAMTIIAVEALAIAPENVKYVTMVIVALAVVACSASGLWGVAYSDFFQFAVATIGTVILAVLSVKAVGGLDALGEKIGGLADYPGRNLNIAPKIGPAEHQMSIWNVAGYFLVLVWISAGCGGYMAQRVLACKNVRHASYAMLLNSIVYYGLIAWPWIIVALCSLVVLPDLGVGVTHDHAYPRMIFTILPIGLRGMLVAALLAAFVSTMSTLFNWGASYLVNDIYKPYLHPEAKEHHYVTVSRLVTVVLAIIGGILSHQADRIQDLLAVSYILSAGAVAANLLRWFWWRLNPAAEFAALISSWVLTISMLFTTIFSEQLQEALPTASKWLVADYYLGARMLFATIMIGIITVVTALLTKPADMDKLKSFVLKVRPFAFGWKPVVSQLSRPYRSAEHFGRTVVSWVIVAVCIYSVLLGIGEWLLGSKRLGVLYCVLFAGSLIWTIRRIEFDSKTDA